MAERAGEAGYRGKRGAFAASRAEGETLIPSQTGGTLIPRGRNDFRLE